MSELLGLGDRGFDLFLVQQTHPAFAAMEFDPVTSLQPLGGVAGAHDSRYAQFAGDDRRVGKRRAHIGHDGGGLREDGGPAYVCGAGDKNLARLEQVTIFRPVQPPHNALYNASCPGKPSQ